MYKRLITYVYKMLADSWTTCCTYGVVGYFFFAQQLGGKSWVGDLFSWGDGCLVRISLQYFLPRKYTQHIPWGHIFSEKPFQHWNMLFCVFCLCCFAADSTDLNRSRGQEKDKTIKVKYCLDDKSPCFCFHLSSSHFHMDGFEMEGIIASISKKKTRLYSESKIQIDRHSWDILDW